MTAFTAIADLSVWTTADSNTAIIVFAALYGFGSGAFVSLAPALIAQVSPDMRKIGVRNGTQFAIISVAALVGSPIGGAIAGHDAEPDFLGLQIFCGIALLTGTSFFLLARLHLGGFRFERYMRYLPAKI